MSAPTAPSTLDSGSGPIAPAGPPPSVGDRPEVLAAGAFAGGFLLAMILRRLG
jgi:hypothetical protein